MDNARIQRTDKVVKLIKQNEIVVLVFNQYTTELNNLNIIG